MDNTRHQEKEAMEGLHVYWYFCQLESLLIRSVKNFLLKLELYFVCIGNYFRSFCFQVYAEFEVYGAAVGLSACCVYGGSPYHPQETALKRGVDIVVGTPGRIKVFFFKKILQWTFWFFTAHWLINS